MHPSPRAETTSPPLPRFRRSIEPPREINLLDRLSLHNRSGRVASVGGALLRFGGLCIIVRGCGGKGRASSGCPVFGGRAVPRRRSSRRFASGGFSGRPGGGRDRRWWRPRRGHLRDARSLRRGGRRGRSEAREG